MHQARRLRGFYSHLLPGGRRCPAATQPPTIRAAARARMSSGSQPSPAPALRGVVFDMDGTLTVPNLDFREMYRRAGVPAADDILSAAWRADEQASAVVEEMEGEGRATLQLMVGAGELAVWLGAHGIPAALVTRNSARTVEHFHAHCWLAGVAPMEPAISRDDPFPAKPDPGAMKTIQERWGIADGSSLLM